jgi:hypothetical protein
MQNGQEIKTHQNQKSVNDIKLEKKDKFEVLEEKSEKRNNFEIIEAEVRFPKKSVSDILLESEKLNPQSISNEILDWVINNVESFIDSESKNFKLDIVLDSEESMLEAKKLQDLYRAIPDDPSDLEDEDDADDIIEKCQQCRSKLNSITQSVLELMRKDEERNDKLFQRMSFYQEKIILNPENKKRALEIDETLKNLIQRKEEIKDENERQKIQDKITACIQEGETLINFSKLEGKCSIISFEYEAFSVGVRMQDGSSVKNEKNKKVYKEYVIPEGFTIWIQIVSKVKQRPTTMF